MTSTFIYAFRWQAMKNAQRHRPGRGRAGWPARAHLKIPLYLFISLFVSLFVVL
jgi:hypothetical protein